MLTDAQKEYFKDSKLRDQNGELVTCYHYTNSNFDTFDKDKVTEDSYCGRGFYFTSRQDFGGTFGQNKIECYIDMKNPLILDNMDEYTKSGLLEHFAQSDDYKQGYTPRIEGYPQKQEEYDAHRLQDMIEWNVWSEDVQELINDLMNSHYYEWFLESGNIEDLQYSGEFDELKENEEFMDAINERGLDSYLELDMLRASDFDYSHFHHGTWNDFSEALTEYAKDNGYDGILLDFSAHGNITEIVVFEPNQIKSVNNLYPTQSDNFKDNSAEYFKQKGISPLDAKIQMAKDMKAMNVKTNTKEINKEKERE